MNLDERAQRAARSIHVAVEDVSPNPLPSGRVIAARRAAFALVLVAIAGYFSLQLLDSLGNRQVETADEPPNNNEKVGEEPGAPPTRRGSPGPSSIRSGARPLDERPAPVRADQGGSIGGGSIGRITFVSDRDAGNNEIYVMNADGTNQTRVTNSPGIEVTPRWSPDGTQIAFVSDRSGELSIWIMASDGSSPRRLTVGRTTADGPSWSPDGKRLAFHSLSAHTMASTRGDQAIWVISSDGSDARELTDGSRSFYDPSWSSDGSRIAFVTRSPNADVWAMDPDGSNQTQLTRNSVPDRYPDWSPDRSRIAFVGGANFHYHLTSMHSDGSQVTALTSGPYYDYFPSWSSDGRRIVFDRDPDGRNANAYCYVDPNNQLFCDQSSPGPAKSAIWIVNSDGSGLTRLTNSGATDMMPSFSWGKR